ncbi:MAG TPA: DUF928 domain-containing protein [Verrucomicrobiae bacterium]|nr:DUF928 domain-containing protein [Verrucomicrobiae bacterium]
MARPMTAVINQLRWVTFVGACTCMVAMASALPLTPEPIPKAPTYRSPLPDNPKVRVDGHVRGTDDAALTLTVLAPERVGLTTKEQPSLYWFQSKPVSSHCELTIVEKNAIKPLFEMKFDAATGGIQRVRLADYNISLAEGVEYRWSVAIVLDPENRSSDIVASGIIERVKPTEKLRQRLQGAPASELPYIYADEGVWYDSLETLSQLVDAKPKDAKLHEIRAVYFMQVGLHDAAMFEMQSAGKTAQNQEH